MLVETCLLKPQAILLKVEYIPISPMEKARQIMEEFVDICKKPSQKRSVPGHFLHMEPNFAEYGLLDYYTPQHTAVQYATVVPQMIATQTRRVQAARN